MTIRDWLAVIVIIAIALVILDGFRRKWLDRKNRIVMKLDKNIPPADPKENEEEILTKTELPSGGARIIPRSGETLEEEVPVLMEPVDLDGEEIEEYSSALDDVDIESSDPEVAETEMEAEYAASLDDELDAVVGESDSSDNFDDDINVHQSDDGERIEPTFGDEELTFARDDQGELDLEHHNLIDHDNADNVMEAEQDQAEEVIIINVMAKPDLPLEGRRLLPILLRQGMRLGEMSIFHRHADSDGNGPVMFSMANMLKPGTFSLSEMEEFSTPGISFFMQLPNKLGNMQCFEQMLNTAEAIKDELDAELKDENRSVFTRQTIEHSRQRIRDFELEMLARK